MSGSGRTSGRFLATLLLPLLVAVPATAQTEGEPETAEAPDEVAAELEGTNETQIPKGATFNYRSRGFVDPFLSPDRSRNPVHEGMRPPGIRGMRVEEIAVKGILDTPEGPMAMFLGADGDYYSLRVGDRLYDAYLIEMDLKSGTVWFRQENPDRNALRPYRDVPKTLYPEQEVRP
jgi:hypothetical protein